MSRHMKTWMPVLLALTLATGCDDDDGDAPVTDAAMMDVGVDAALDAGPNAEPSTDHLYARPTPRPVTNTVMVNGAPELSGVVAVDGALRALTDRGRLHDPDAEHTVLRRDLPSDARLLPDPNGGAWVMAPEGISRLDDPTVLLTPPVSMRLPRATADALYWLDDEDGGRVAKFPLPAGPVTTLVGDIGDPRGLFVEADGVWVGRAGDEPRALLHFGMDGADLGAVASRFVPTDIIRIDGDLYALMMTGAGWLERLDGERMTRLTYAPRGSKGLQVVDGALWWFTNAAIYRLEVPDGTPQPMVTDIHPVSLVVEAGRIVWADRWQQRVLSVPR